MNKTIVSRKISKELEVINERIDAKIIRGLAYEREAQKHRDLLLTLQRLHKETDKPIQVTGRHSRLGKSPVRQSLRQGVFARLFGRKLAF